MYRGSQGAVVGKKARTFKVCATLGCTETFHPFRALWWVGGELMVLVGLLFFFCVKRTPVCVCVCVCVCRIQNLHWGLKRLWAGNDCCCKTSRLVSPQLSGFTTGRSSHILPVTSHPLVKHGQSHHTWILSYLMISEGFPSTLRFLFRGQSHTRLCRGVFVLQWHPPLGVQHSYYLRYKGF